MKKNKNKNKNLQYNFFSLTCALLFTVFSFVFFIAEAQAEAEASVETTAFSTDGTPYTYTTSVTYNIVDPGAYAQALAQARELASIISQAINSASSSQINDPAIRQAYYESLAGDVPVTQVGTPNAGYYIAKSGEYTLIQSPIYIGSGGEVISGDPRARFYTLTVLFSGEGSGVVKVGDVTCTKKCKLKYEIKKSGTRSGFATALLNAAPFTNSKFDKWSGDGCSGVVESCNVLMDKDRTITAYFDSLPSAPCFPDCACAENVCKGNSCSNGCGGNCAGKKNCSSSWREVAP